MPGDELKLRHPCPNGGPAWEGAGQVVRLDATEEVALEMKDVVSVLKLSVMPGMM